MKLLQLLVCALLSTSLLSQNSATSISEKLEDFFEKDKVALHLQTNKTVYFAGEEIWFSTYAFNRREGNIERQDLNVVAQLLDENNEVLLSSLLLISNGTQSGSFLLKPTLKAGLYTLILSKAGGLERKTDEIFVQTIKVLNSESEDQVTVSDFKRYDIQLLPEGGHLVVGIQNTCGIKIVNSNGKGVQSSDVVLMDNSGNIVKEEIKTNDLGMGKFTFTPKPNTKYHVLTNDQKVELPRSNRYGVILNTVQNFKTGDLNVTLKANEETLKRLANKEVSILIHKDKSSQVYTVNFEPDYPEITFQIPNKKLYPGVNVVTVFNAEKEPLLERLLFNHKSVLEVKSFVTVTHRKKDTFTYSIVNKVNERSIRSTSSISVLPATNSGNINRESIYASVYLKPYVKGRVENPAYYFSRNNYQKQYEIDLLLLNQGWSKYSWSQIFMEKNKAVSKQQKPGISLNGYVRAHNDRDIPVQVLLYSKDNENLSVEDLDQEARFVLDSLPFTKGTELNFSALDANGEPIMANFFYTIDPRAGIYKNLDDIEPVDFFTEEFREPTTSIFSSFPEELDTVVISTNKLKYEKFFKGWDGRKMTTKEKNKGNLRNFISTYGYYVIFDENAQARRLGRWVMNPNGRGSNFIEPSVVVDGVGYRAIDIGEMISLQDVDEIYADRIGRVHTFIVFTDGKWARNSDEITSKSFVLKEGFMPKKEFYTPQYTSYASEEYKKYGVVSWHQKVESNEEGYSQIELVNPGQNDLLFYSEGYSEDGRPIASVVKVKVKVNSVN